jgi:penicillin-binding protein 2
MVKRADRGRGVFTRRVLLLGAGQLGAFGFLADQLYRVQVVEGARYATLARNNRISERLLAPPRGRLFDRDEVPLAGNLSTWRALLIAEQTPDANRTLDAFSRLVPLDDRDRQRIARELRRQRRFIPVLVRDSLNWEEMAILEVHAPDLPGILIDAGTSRTYPQGETLAHVVGYVAPPNQAEVTAEPLLALPGMRVGRAGTEKFCEPALRGQPGVVQLEVNAVGRVIREIDRQEGVAGDDIGLTIHNDLQSRVFARLQGLSASAVVLDCRNGEVLAMASSPSFDPNLFISGVSPAQWTSWIEDPLAPLTNKAVAGLYAPGSTFKPVVAMAGLEGHAVTLSERINCPGYIDIGTTRFHCWKRGGHGELDLRGALKNSCDVYFYEVARRLGMDPMAAMANRFGLGVPLGIELPEARSGLVPTRAWWVAQGHAWNLGDTVVHGIGQGFLQLPPFALAVMAARVATGRAVLPHLVRTVGGALQKGAQPEDWPSLGLSARYLQAVRDGMWEVVNQEGGTATIARLPLSGVQMAGKTGSSQVMHVTREQYRLGFDSAKLPWKLRPHALFIAFAPTSAPRYALAVVVEHGNAGASTAGPIARDIMVDTLTLDPAGTPPPAAGGRR